MRAAPHSNRSCRTGPPLVGETEPSLPCNDPPGSDTAADGASLSVTLDETQTQLLLTQAPRAYRTQINDLLLTALAQTLCEWSGRNSVLIELEGHGREELVSGIDLSRTVGWFTNLYPVRLTPQGEPGSSIKAIKEQLRGVPGRGMGFGVLRYLTAVGARLADAAYPQVSFTYLGPFDQSFAEGALWRPAQESSAVERSPSSRQRCWFRVGAHILERCLTLNWSYRLALHTHAEVQHLLERFTAHLAQLAQHLASGVRGGDALGLPAGGSHAGGARCAADPARADRRPVSNDPRCSRGCCSTACRTPRAGCMSVSYG